MKKICLIVAIVLGLSALGVCAVAVADSVNNTLYVRFVSNCTEDVTLSSGKTAVGENLLVSSQRVAKGSKLTVPTEVPQRDGYDFVGWSAERNGNTPWNFDNTVSSNMILYAMWTRTAQQQEEEYMEPKLTFVEEVSQEVDTLQVYGVCNMFVKDGTANVTKTAINYLTANADNVKELLNYRRNPACSVTSAVYANGKVTVDYSCNGVSGSVVVNVVDVTGTLAVDNSTYESKAVKYEGKSITPYGVVMGGSSSMENWSTSTEDMSPITTINVGIGGTTVEQWRDKLAQRLIYPHNPRAVVLYVGINNIINNNKTGTQTGNALKELFDDIHLHLPNTTIYYILINYVPGYYVKYGNDITTANDIVKQYASSHNYVCLIDAGAGLMKASGKPNTAYFLTDGLHMSLCGYTVWGGEVKKQFILHETELYK